MLRRRRGFETPTNTYQFPQNIWKTEFWQLFALHSACGLGEQSKYLVCWAPTVWSAYVFANGCLLFEASVAQSAGFAYILPTRALYDLRENKIWYPRLCLEVQIVLRYDLQTTFAIS